MNAYNGRNMIKIRNLYDPDNGDIAVGANGQFVKVTWAEYALIEMIAGQQREIDALKRQVTRLVKRVPSAGIPEKK